MDRGARLFQLCCLCLAIAAHADTFTTNTTSLPTSAGRKWHTATLLQNGKILVAGGLSTGGFSLATTLIVDPLAGTITVGPSMTHARDRHTATLLKNGQVLIAGGVNENFQTNAFDINFNADLYDPVSNTITATGTMTTSRYDHTATLLTDGRVLLAGGIGGLGPGILASGEIYNPSGSGAFTPITVGMSVPRHRHAATLLPDGHVLITGGVTNDNSFTIASTIDVFTGTSFLQVGAFSVRCDHTATLLQNGKVLLAGGMAGPYPGAATATTDLVSISGAGAVTVASGASLKSARYEHTATLLPNGDVLLTGGGGSTDPLSGGVRNDTETFRPNATTGSTTVRPSMAVARQRHTATMLTNGRVLIIGGYNLDANSNFNFAYPLSIETYEAQPESLALSTSLANGRISPVTVLLPNGKVLVLGGTSSTVSGNFVLAAELIDPTFSPATVTSAGSLDGQRSGMTATLLQNGNVLIVGGYNGRAALGSALLYDPASNAFTQTGILHFARYGHTATLLQNGKVLIAGGKSATPIIVPEIYDPVSGTFSDAAPMKAARYAHAATLLRDGRVFLSGGNNGSFPLNSTEIYDPATDTFVFAQPMATPRQDHGMVTLQTGAVFIYALNDDKEIYHPDSGAYSAVNGIGGQMQKGVLLPDGTVLITTGYNYNFSSEDGFKIFNPTTEAILPVGALWRDSATPVLLRDGRVLMAGGMNQVPSSCCPAATDTVIYNPHPDPALRPSFNIGFTICEPAPVSLTGATHLSGSEGSSGSTSNSAANTPLLRLQSAHDGTLHLIPATSWTDTTFTAQISSVPFGFYRIAVVSNGVASNTPQLVEVSPFAPILGNYANTTMTTGQNRIITPSAAPDTHGTTGVNFTVSPSSAGGAPSFLGNLTINGSTGEVTITDAHPAGLYTVTISAAVGCGTATKNFTLTVNPIERPTVATAEAQSSSDVMITWAAVDGAATYDMYRSTDVTLPARGRSKVGTTRNTSYNDSLLAADKTYVYEVEAVDADGGGSGLSDPDIATTRTFADEPLAPGSAITAAYFDHALVAVNAVRAAANLPTASFAHAPLGGKAITESEIATLRTALNEARSVILGSQVTFTFPATAGTAIHAVDLGEIRNGVK
jgi:hypothetical protein